jgi:hypothetical protein
MFEVSCPGSLRAPRQQPEVNPPHPDPGSTEMYNVCVSCVCCVCVWGVCVVCEGKDGGR